MKGSMKISGGGLETNASLPPGGTLSAIANISKKQKLTIIAEAKPLIGAAAKAKDLWNAMRKADFRKEGMLNEANISLVFEKNKANMEDLLKISKGTDLLEVFDTDKDGFLSEDEQILIFSVIKEKIQIVSEACSNIHEYVLFKDLMKEVRILEKDIVQYQDELRKNIHSKQLEEYVDIGKDKLKEFKETWEAHFNDFDQESEDKLEKLKNTHKEQIERLSQELERAIESVKVKPLPKLKELQNQEKLVALNERIEEAQNYRKELKDLERKEDLRIMRVKEDNAEKRRRKLLKLQEKERDELLYKIENKRHKMQIGMEKELEILNKALHLHINDIKKIQAYLSQGAMKKGSINDELRRAKENSRKTMKHLNAFKSAGAGKDTMKMSKTGTMGGGMERTIATMSNPLGNALLFTNKNKISMTINTSLDLTSTNAPAYRAIILPLRSLADADCITRFDIRPETNTEQKPINIEESNVNVGLRKKINSLLSQRKEDDQSVPSLCDMFDENLNYISLEDASPPLSPASALTQ